MTNRYEILDILGQDGRGVSFHAIDRESGDNVVLRRFFPFGPDGGGLEKEESEAYELAVARLKEISHPALRSVLDGGADPVDGIPFLVIEKTGGVRLSDRLKEGPLSSESVRALADLVLETSQALSDVLGEDAIWVETDLSTIIICDDDAERPITFRICPARWLGDPSARSDLKPLLEMVEDLTGWRGQMISRSSGAGLGAWVKTLRDEPSVWTLAQAKAALHEPATIVEASAAQAATQAAAAPAPRQQVVFVNKTVVWPWILVCILALSAAGFLAWKQYGTPETVVDSAPSEALSISDPPTETSTPAEPSQEIAAADKPAREPAAPAPKPKPSPPKPAAASATESRLEAMNRRAAEMAAQAEDNALITLGEKATIEGTITSIQSSQTGKSKYFQFKTAKGGQLLWAMFRVSDWDDFDLSTLESFDGKKASFTGRWAPESSSRKTVLRMTSPKQLELLD